MRRVIVDQMEALAELNRIVARHGRAMDAVGAADQSAARRGYGDEDPVIPLPESAVRVEPAAAGRGRAAVVAPLPPAAGTTDWSSLQQRGRTDASLEPPPRTAAAGPERSATSRGRAEPPPPEPPARAARSTPGSDRNGSQRGRIEPPPPERPAASEWSTPRGLYEAPSVAPAGHEAGKGADGSGGWLSSLLTRASKDGDDASHSDDRGAVKPGRPVAHKERVLPNDDGNSLSSDVAHMIDQDVAADLWKRYNRGERNISSRRLYTPQGRKAFEEMRKRYNADREFRQIVDSYIGGVDQILGQVDVASETGQIYTLLAHAAGRFE
jgi:hypothetical protein